MVFYKKTIIRSDMQSVLMSMADEEIGPGKRGEYFKEELGNYFNFKNMLLMRSLVSAFFTCLDVLEISAGDKVVISCFTPILYKSLLEEIGVELIVKDVNITTGTLDVAEIDDIEDAKLVFAVPSLGHIPDLSKFKEIGISTMLDLTDCVGLDVDVSTIDIAIMSLEDDKMITSAGGGCILSNTYKFPKILREEALSDLNSSLSLMQLESYDLYLKKRRDIQKTFAQAVEMSNNRIFSLYNPMDDSQVEPSVSESSSESKEAIQEKPSAKDNAFKFAILLENFNDALKFLEKKKIPVRKSFEKTAYEDMEKKESFKNASYLYNRVYSFPFYYFLKTEEIELIRKVIAVLP